MNPLRFLRRMRRTKRSKTQPRLQLVTDLWLRNVPKEPPLKAWATFWIVLLLIVLVVLYTYGVVDLFCK